jgi:hypothetical protein
MQKGRCIKKPFDYISFCGQNTRSHMVSHDLDSAFLNIINRRSNSALCLTCISELSAMINSYNNDKIGEQIEKRT